MKVDRKKVEQERKRQIGDGINKKIIDKGRKLNQDKIKKKK